jgi:hypothetical protein
MLDLDTKSSLADCLYNEWIPAAHEFVAGKNIFPEFSITTINLGKHPEILTGRSFMNVTHPLVRRLIKLKLAERVSRVAGRLYRNNLLSPAHPLLRGFADNCAIVCRNTEMASIRLLMMAEKERLLFPEVARILHRAVRGKTTRYLVANSPAARRYG